MSVLPDQIVLNADQKRHLARLAEQIGKPWDAVLAEALATLEHGAAGSGNGETVYEAMVRLGLLGSVKDGPADLSTNTRYMEGFGQRE
jgi:hypothetical protein